MPERLIATISFQPSIETLLKLRLGRLMPALLTRMSMRPERLRIFSAAFATSPCLATSRAMASPLPAAFTSFSACFSVWALRPESTTCTPARASSMPAARPMPEPPPVIQATFPSRIFFLSLGRLGGAEQVLLLLVAHLRAPPLGEHLHRALHRGALEDRVAPALERRVLVDLHALALGRAQPGHDRHVGDGVLVARHVFAFTKSFFNDPVQPVRLVLVAIHGVLDLLRR